jgi:hypothetical protein
VEVWEYHEGKEIEMIKFCRKVLGEKHHLTGNLYMWSFDDNRFMSIENLL